MLGEGGAGGGGLNDTKGLRARGAMATVKTTAKRNVGVSVKFEEDSLPKRAVGTLSWEEEEEEANAGGKEEFYCCIHGVL